VCVCLCDPIVLHDKSVVFLFNIGGFPNRGRYCFLFCKSPILILRPTQKYMPDCRKSHLIFQNFLVEAPRPLAGARAVGSRFGASKIPGSAPAVNVHKQVATVKNRPRLHRPKYSAHRPIML